MNSGDNLLLERLATGPIIFTYSPDVRGGKHVKLTKSTVSPSQKKHLHRLARSGHVASEIHGDPCAMPPHTTLTFTITALGRSTLVPRRAAPNVHHHVIPSEEQLAAESNG